MGKRELSSPIEFIPLAAEHTTMAWELNQHYAAQLSSLTIEDFEILVSHSVVSLAAVRDLQLVGFILVLDENAPYRSENYCWFVRRFSAFLYIDRVAVEPLWQGRSIGTRLYRAVAERALELKRASLCCEVNHRPRNVPSLRFHQELGFVPCGNRTYAGAEREVLMLVHDRLEDLAAF